MKIEEIVNKYLTEEEEEKKKYWIWWRPRKKPGERVKYQKRVKQATIMSTSVKQAEEDFKKAHPEAEAVAASARSSIYIGPTGALGDPE
jgi:hypothetical protein